jgi:hypothetical protein
MTIFRTLTNTCHAPRPNERLLRAALNEHLSRVMHQGLLSKAALTAVIRMRAFRLWKLGHRTPERGVATTSPSTSRLGPPCGLRRPLKTLLGFPPAG